MINTFMDPLRSDKIIQCLAQLNIKCIQNIQVFQCLASTNDYFKQEQFKISKEISVCIADEQTKGRGRFGHQWQSPKGANLYLSMLWPLKKWSSRYEGRPFKIVTTMLGSPPLDIADERAVTDDLLRSKVLNVS